MRVGESVRDLDLSMRVAALGYGLFSVTCTSQWARVGKWVAGELVASVFSSGYRSVLCVL